MKLYHNENDRQFELYEDNGTLVGELVYQDGDDGTLHALHTRIFDGYEGHGYAAQLLDGLVAYAEEENARIVPSCLYVKDAFEKHPDIYINVL